MSQEGIGDLLGVGDAEKRNEQHSEVEGAISNENRRELEENREEEAALSELKKNLDSAIKMLQFNRWKASRPDEFGVSSHMTPRRGILPGRESTNGVGEVEKRETVPGEAKNESTATPASHAATTTYYQGVQGGHGLNDREEEEKRMEEVKKKVEEELQKIDSFLQRHTSSHYPSLVSLHSISDRHKKDLKNMKPKIDSMTETVKKGREDLISLRSSLLLSLLHRIDLFSKEAFSYYASHALNTAHDLKSLQKAIFQFKSKFMISELQSSSSTSSLAINDHKTPAIAKGQANISAAAKSSGLNAKQNLPGSLLPSASAASPPLAFHDRLNTPSKNVTSTQRSLPLETSSRALSSYDDGEDFFETDFEEVDLNELGNLEEARKTNPNESSSDPTLITSQLPSSDFSPSVQEKLTLLEEGLEIVTKAERLYKKYLSLQFKTRLYIQLSQDVESNLNVEKEGDDAHAAKPTTNQAKERSLTAKPTSPTSHHATSPNQNASMKETSVKMALFQQEDDWIQSSLLPSLITSLSLLTHLCLSLIIKHEALSHGNQGVEEKAKKLDEQKSSSTAVVTCCLGHLKILLDIHASLAIESSFIQQVRAQVIEPLLVFPILASASSTPTNMSPLVTQYGFNPILAAQAWSGDASESTIVLPSSPSSTPSTTSTAPSTASPLPSQSPSGSELPLKSPLWKHFLSPILSYLRSSRLLQFVGTYASSSLHRPLSLAIHIAKQRKESLKKSHTSSLATSTIRTESQAFLENQRIGMKGEEGSRWTQQEILENEAHAIFLKACAPLQPTSDENRKDSSCGARFEPDEKRTSEGLHMRASQEAPYYRSFMNVLQSLRKVVSGTDGTTSANTLSLGPLALLGQSSSAHYHLYPHSLVSMCYENADKSQQASSGEGEDDTKAFFSELHPLSEGSEELHVDDWWNASSEERHELPKEVDKKWYLNYLAHLPFPFGMPPPLVTASDGGKHSDDLERMMGEETSLSHAGTDGKSRSREERQDKVVKASNSSNTSSKRTTEKEGASRASLDGDSPRSSSHTSRHSGSLTNSSGSPLHSVPSQEDLLARRGKKLTSSSQHSPNEAPSLSSLIKSLLKTSREEYDRTNASEKSAGTSENVREMSGLPISAATPCSHSHSSHRPSSAPVNFFNVLPASDFAIVMGMGEEEIYSLLLRLLQVFPSSNIGKPILEADLSKGTGKASEADLSQKMTLPRWFYRFPSSPFLWIDLIWNPMLASIVSAASGNSGGSSQSANLYKSIFSPSLSPSVRRRNMILFAHFCEELEGNMNDLFQVLSFRLSSSSSSLPSPSQPSKISSATGPAAKSGSEKASGDVTSLHPSSASLKTSSAPQSSWMMQHWNLTGYVSLHTKHVVETFELSFTSLLAPSRLPQLFQTVSASNSQSLHPLVALLEQSIVNIWNPNAFLFPLTHRFLKLSLQLFHQFYLHICGKGGDMNASGTLLDASSNSTSPTPSQNASSTSAVSATFLSLLEGAHMSQTKWQEENEGNMNNTTSSSQHFSTCKALIDVLIGLEKWISQGGHEVSKAEETKDFHPRFSNSLFTKWIPQISTSSHQEAKVWALVQDSLKEGILQSYSLIHSSFYLKLPSLLLSSYPMQSFTTNMKEIGQRYRFGSTLPTSSQNPTSPSKHLTTIFNQFIPLFSNVSEAIKQASLDENISNPETCPSFPWLAFFNASTSYASYSNVLKLWHEPMAKEVVKSVIVFLANSFLSSSKTLLTSSQKTQAFIDRKKKAGHGEIAKDQNIQNSDFDVFSLPPVLPAPDSLIQTPFPLIPASPPLPDHSKILIQLQLDLLFFSKALLLLNLSFEDIPSMQPLWSTINGQNTQ